MWHHETADENTRIWLRRIVDEQQKAEQNMAKALAEAINKDMAVMGCLRGLVANAMEDIRWITLNAGEEPFKTALLKDAVNYAWVRERYGIQDRKHLTADQQKDLLRPKCTDFHTFLTENQGANVFGMSAYQCADLIRFYGEVLEACEKLFKPKDKVIKGLVEDKRSAKEKTAYGVAKKLVGRAKGYQLGPPQQWQKKGVGAERGRTFGGLGLTPDGKKWDDTRWSSPLPPKRPMFKDNTPSGKEKYNEELEKYEERLEEYNIICEFIKKRTTTELRIAKMRGGVSLWVHTPADRVAKVDKVFGLAHAATISGTTTDNIFFYNRMSLVDRYLGQDCTQPWNPTLDQFLDRYYAAKKPGIHHQAGISKVASRNWIIDPIFYIIPLGAIVGAGHHSTIECAFPLALNGIVDYTIKNYGSLFPLARAQRSIGGGGEIKAVLDAYEGRRDNRRLLIYYDSSGYYAGYVEFERGRDDDVWSQVARANQSLLSKFAGFSQYPTKEQVASLHPHVAQAMKPAPDVPGPRKGSLGTSEQQQKFRSVKDSWEERIRKGGKETV